ncbi:hypothetical protein [Chryseobacterium proteolyticum]|uniref:hypothetical protein n=1 Tax=Chryseobacterium proteolyticum TaxID=118127 RepID=UPI0039834BC5
MSIIWGYNSTQPIAKIEGITYDQVSQIAGSQLTAFISASNTDASAFPGDAETALLSAMETFRAAVGVQSSGITTYTYDALVGVRSITSPLGVRELYYYDSANRLKEIKQVQTDTSGVTSLKMVKEFKYNYKN